MGIGVDVVFDGPAVFVATKTSLEHYRSKLKNILLTNPGERYMRPTLGTSLRRFVFEPWTDITKSRMEQTLRQELGTQIPELQIVELDLAGSVEKGLVGIYIQFRIIGSELTQSMNLMFQS